MKQTQKNQLEDLLDRRVVVAAFDRMRIAEDLIAEYGLKKDKQIFIHLMPPKSFEGKADAVYEAHARELCFRRAGRLPLRPATNAEILVGLLATSELAPLKSTYVEVCEWMFGQVFGASEQLARMGERRKPRSEAAFIDLVHELRETFAEQERS